MQVSLIEKPYVQVIEKLFSNKEFELVKLGYSFKYVFDIKHTLHERSLGMITCPDTRIEERKNDLNSLSMAFSLFIASDDFVLPFEEFTLLNIKCQAMLSVEFSKINNHFNQMYPHFTSNKRIISDISDNIYFIYKIDHSSAMENGKKMFILIRQFIENFSLYFPIKQLSKKLILLLNACKEENNSNFDLEFIKLALKNEYGYDIKMIDAIRLCVSAYIEMVTEPKFKIPYRGDLPELITNILLHPIKRDILNLPTLQTNISYSDFYNSILNKLLSDMMLSRVDWCRDQLDLQ